MAAEDLSASANVVIIRRLDRLRAELLLDAAGARVEEGTTKAAMLRSASRLTPGRLAAQLTQHELERLHDELRPGATRRAASLERTELEAEVVEQLASTDLATTKCQDCAGTGRCRRCELYITTRAQRLLGDRAEAADPLIEGCLRQRTLTIERWLDTTGRDRATSFLVEAVIDAVKTATSNCRDCGDGSAQCKHCLGTGLTLVDESGAGQEQPATALLDHDAVPAVLMPPGDFQVPLEFTARLQARFVTAHRSSGGFGGSEGARADLASAPHQASTVLEVLTSFRRRSILADEVGMGKTVEALMVMKAIDNECRLTTPREADAGVGETRTRRCRTLVIVPEHLTYQWLCEIYLRCHEVFHVAEPDHVVAGRKLGHHGVIVSAESVRSSSQARANLLEEDWDLVIVDEAHKARGELYDFLRQLSWGSRRRPRVEHMLFLTATPIEARLSTSERDVRSQQTYENLIRLVEPDRFAERTGTDPYEAAVTLQEQLGAVLAEPDDAGKWLEGVRALLPGRGRLADLLTRAERGPGPDRDRAIHLAAWLGLAGRAVHRTRRVDAPGLFRKRAPRFHVVPSGADPQVTAIRTALQGIASSDGVPDRGRHAARRMLNTFEWRLACSVIQAHSYLGGAINELRSLVPEDQVRRLVDANRALGELRGPEHDQKLAFFLKLLHELVFGKSREHGTDPRRVVVFVEYLETLDYLKRHIPLALPGVDVAEFTSRFENRLQTDGVPPPRLQQLLDFRGSTTKRVLLSADVAAEGHNLHHNCHVLVLFDLGWNPNRTEQRIGRLDRIGQRKDIEIHVLAQEGTRATAALETQRRSGVFDGSLGYLAPDQIDDIEMVQESADPDASELEAVTRTLAGGVRGAFHALREIACSSEITIDPASDRVTSVTSRPPFWVFPPSERFTKEYSTGNEETKALGCLALGCGVAVLDVMSRRSNDLEGIERNDFGRYAPGVEHAFAFLENRGRGRIGALQRMAEAMRAAVPWLRPRFGVFRRSWGLAHDHLEFYGSGHPLIEEILLRSLDPRCGRLAFVRFNRPLPGPIARGVLMQFMWDPARIVAGSTPFERTLQRVARAIWPTCVLPVLVGVSTDGRRLIVDGDLSRPDGPLATALQLLGELDKRTCSLAEVPAEAEAAVLGWLRSGQKEALEPTMRSWLDAGEQAVAQLVPRQLTTSQFGDRKRILDRAIAEVEESHHIERERAQRDIDRASRLLETVTQEHAMFAANKGRLDRAREVLDSIVSRQQLERARLDCLREPLKEVRPRLDQIAVFRVDLS